MRGICPSTILQSASRVSVSTTEAVVLISIDINGFRVCHKFKENFQTLQPIDCFIPETARAYLW
jgi:hypothetical protein